MRPETEMPVAVFDSGVGGLSVLRSLVAELPGEDFIYFGDRKNAPYGGRTHAEIKEIAEKNAGMLFGLGAKALVVACNTATAAGIEQIREKYPDRPVIGIEPAVKPAFEAGCRRVAVMATPRTVGESRFSSLLEELSARFSALAFGLPCPGLSEAVERGEVRKEYFDSLFSGLEFDGLVLGCTHYPFASAEISAAAPGIPLFDGASGTARQTRRRLAEEGLLRRCDGRRGKVEFIPDDGGAAERFWKEHL
ncbi:MAG: glutamate racemase [Clostridia bacterium]|nr:glutamate racemase [Clostridia bacterium]